MHYTEWSFAGMHLFWWLLWILVVAWIFSPITPVPSRRETALEVLQRRYAAGEISTDDYEERKARLKRDTKAVNERVTQ